MLHTNTVFYVDFVVSNWKTHDRLTIPLRIISVTFKVKSTKVGLNHREKMSHTLFSSGWS